MGYTRAELAGVSIPDDMMRTIRLAEERLGWTLDLEGQIIDMLQREQERLRRERLPRLLDELKRIGRGWQRELLDIDRAREALDAKQACEIPQLEARAAMRAEEARRLSLRRRLGPPRVTRLERPRRRVCQLASAWRAQQ